MLNISLQNYMDVFIFLLAQTWYGAHVDLACTATRPTYRNVRRIHLMRMPHHTFDVG